MSDDENNTPSKQTSSVPLKKETVRVTLKAADAPPAKPSATLPPTPPPTSPAKPPSPPVPPSAGATKPLEATAPPAGAPTKPKAPAPAPTIKLATSKAPVGAPTIALKTANAPLPGGGGSGSPSVSLPKATVALNPPTKPLSPGASPATAAGTKSPLATVEEDEDESGVSTFMNILAGVGLVAAIVVLALQLKVANIWISAEDADSTAGWSQLLE